MKNIGRKIIGILIAMTMSFSVIASIDAGDYKPLATHSGSLLPSASTVEIGDTFYVWLYIDSGVDSVTSFTVRQLLFNLSTAGLANITTNPGGVMNVNLNSSFSATWIVGSMTDDGDLYNAQGNLSYGPSSVCMGGITGNNTAARMNFTSLYPGILQIYIPRVHYTGNSGLDIGVGAADFWTNTTVTITPLDPASFTATMYNYTIINLTWTKGTGDDNVTVCGKTTGYPTGPDDSILYNGSNLTYNHTGLNNCTTWYYRAWGWNETAKLHSYQNDSAYATTQCYSNFSFAGATPANSTGTANCTYSIPVNVTVINSKGYSFSYWINGSNGQSTSGSSAANASVGFTMTGLTHNASIWWNVTVLSTQAGDSDSYSYNYNFTTGMGSTTAPTATVVTPTNGQTNIPITVGTMAVTVTDVDGDFVNTTFYWSNGTVIGWVDFQPSGTVATLSTTQNLGYSTTYTWYVSTRDACSAATSSSWTFTTQTSAITLTKTWTVLANNTVQAWINATNAGQTNLTDVTINETSYSSYLTLVGSNVTMNTGTTNWTIGYLNITGYVNNSWWTIAWFELNARVPNGTTFTNSIKANTTIISSLATSNTLTYSYFITKTANRTAVFWNDTAIQYFINITNTGDFNLNGTKINETYSPNMTFGGSIVAGNQTNESFNFTQITPGSTSALWIRVNKTAADLVNGTRIYNNITSTTNETSAQLSLTTYVFVGARTEQIQVNYVTTFTDVGSIGSSVLTILGVALIIGSIMLIVVIVRKYGGGEGGVGE